MSLMIGWDMECIFGRIIKQELKWAVERQKRKGKNIADAAVIGAVIQLGYCCDLLDSRFTGLIKAYYNLMEEAYKRANRPLPINRDSPFDIHKNKLLRLLDCTVIEYMHARIEERYRKDKKDKGFSEYKIFDSTRGVFMEGDRAYHGAEIFEKSHVQVCIRNSNCIKGFFLPRNEIDFLPV